MPAATLLFEKVLSTFEETIRLKDIKKRRRRKKETNSQPQKNTPENLASTMRPIHIDIYNEDSYESSSQTVPSRTRRCFLNQRFMG